MTENDFAPDQKRGNRHAVLYFDKQHSANFKELATRIRSEGGRTTLVWSDRWKGAENLLMEARAVVVQKDCLNADKIVAAYQQYAADVEIHVVNQEGEFEDDEPTFEADPDTETDTAVQEDTGSGDSGDEEDAPEAEGDSGDSEVSEDGGEAGPEESTDQGGASSYRLED